jgi:hypothetical protein
MAKLDKAQLQYAITRIDQLANKAAANAKYVTKVMPNEELTALLNKKGFTVRERYNLNGYISVTQTEAQAAAEKKAREAADKKAKEIYALAQTAKDEVMLGDSAEITAVLATLAEKLGV